ncbi:MAG: hypothetical protein AABX78_03090, partial [Nanoarchaeota archaeon]
MAVNLLLNGRNVAVDRFHRRVIVALAVVGHTQPQRQDHDQRRHHGNRPHQQPIRPIRLALPDPQHYAPQSEC